MVQPQKNPMSRRDRRAESEAEPLAISLKTLARQLDAGRSSVRRWLKDSGIHPISVGRGRKGAIRYRWSEVEAWLQSRPEIE
jgi:predicted DNA-binding transcriptional regulator AlpA